MMTTTPMTPALFPIRPQATFPLPQAVAPELAHATQPALVTNRRIADMLFNIATLLDMAQDNPYRVRAYRRAARRILALREEASNILARGDELPLPGVGTRIRRKLAELISSGSMSFYQDLLEDLPRSMRTLMEIEGIGPRIASRLYQELDLSTADDVIAAAEAGMIREMYGFGAKSEANLAAAARRQRAAATRAAA